MIKGSLMLHLGSIWYHSEPSDVPYSQNLPRPIFWFGLFLQQNDSSGLWKRGHLKILNGIKLISGDQGNHLDSYTYNQFGVIQVHYSAKQLLVRIFFCCFLQQTGSSISVHCRVSRYLSISLEGYYLAITATFFATV